MAAQVLHIGLDTYTGILLYTVIIANADPIHFVAPPEDSHLIPGKIVCLYTKNTFSLVAKDTVVESLAERSGASRLLSAQGTRRVKVSLTDILMPGAIAPYPDGNDQRRPLTDCMIGTEVAWDTVSANSSVCFLQENGHFVFVSCGR